MIVWALAVQDSAPRRVESVPAVDLRRGPAARLKVRFAPKILSFLSMV